MKQSFSYTIWQEDDGFIAQCLEVDVASQGDTPEEAVSNLREALELHFEPPMATLVPKIGRMEVDISAA